MTKRGNAPNAVALARLERRERWVFRVLCLPAIGLVAIVILIPAGWLFGLSFVDDNGSLSLVHYRRMLELKSYWMVFKTTFQLSALVTVLCVMIGYPLAYLLSELPRRVANICLFAVLLPFWTSLLVRTYAWLVLLQRKGVINKTLIDLGIVDAPLRLAHNFTGATIGMTHIMLPFLVLPLYASMIAIDRSYMLAGATLGASPSRVFRDVFLPLSLPGLFAGAALVFVLCLGFFVTPALLGGGKVVMIANQIDLNLRMYNSWGAASALGVVLLLLTGVVLYFSYRVTKVGVGPAARR